MRFTLLIKTVHLSRTINKFRKHPCLTLSCWGIRLINVAQEHESSTQMSKDSNYSVPDTCKKREMQPSACHKISTAGFSDQK